MNSSETKLIDQHKGIFFTALSPLRLVVVICILIIGLAAIYYGKSGMTSTSTGEDIHERMALFPKQIGNWKYVGDNRFSQVVDEMLGADAYIDYYYKSPDYIQVEVLVSYFSAMYEGKQFHSPKNCMLGSGWDPIKISHINILYQGKLTPINFMKVRKDSQNLYVLYWVQGRGRLLASEYKERVFRVIDSFIKQRSDAAFVRITLPVGQVDTGSNIELLTNLSTQVADAVEAMLP